MENKKNLKIPKHKRGGSLVVGKKYINREIIYPQDYYIIRYNDDNGLNNQNYYNQYNWEIQESQLNENEQEFEEVYSPQNIYYYSQYEYI